MDHAYLFNIGEDFESYNFFGAHRHEQEGVKGWIFRLWAPKAVAVTVFGSFNNWNKLEYYMQKEQATGIFTLFIPHLEDWTRYKYYVQQLDGKWVEKTDPYARHFEERPGNAAILLPQAEYQWQDAAFIKARKSVFEPRPLNIYELHIGSWRRYPDGNCISYRALAEELPAYLQDMGYNAVEFMPLTEYPLDASWGYQVTGYFAPTSRYGAPDDLKYLVDKLHQADIKVIFDWVPAHFPKDEFGLARFDGTAQYEYADPLKGEQPSWGTLIFDFAKQEVNSFLISSANFWIKEFHGDGIRVDAVSSMLYLDFCRPKDSVKNIYGGNENLEAIAFIKRLNCILHELYPYCLLIAEESTAYPYITKSVADNGLGFTHKWNMGWMHDTLDYFSLDYLYRKYHHNLLTFSLTYAFSENYILPFSHDEVVHGKRSLIGRMQGDIWRQCASLRNMLAWQIAHPGAKLNFMGNEFAQFIEWKFYEELEWFMLEYEHHYKFKNYVKHLNYLYLQEPALWRNDHDWSGFKWLQVNDADNSVYAFARMTEKKEDCLVFIFNNTPAVIDKYVLELPFYGKYQIILNSDDKEWYGSAYIGNIKELQTSLKSQADAGYNFKLMQESYNKRLHEFSAKYVKLKKELAALKESYLDLLLDRENYGRILPIKREDLISVQQAALQQYNLADLAITELQLLTAPNASLELKLPPLAVLVLKYKGE